MAPLPFREKAVCFCASGAMQSSCLLCVPPVLCFLILEEKQLRKMIPEL